MPSARPATMNFDLQMKFLNFVPGVSRPAIFSRRSLCFQPLSRRAAIIRTILSSRFLVTRPLLRPDPFFSPSIRLFPPLRSSSFILRRRYRSAVSFLLTSRELSCRMPDRGGKPDVKFANGLNSNYPGVSFARSLRSAFFFFLRHSLSRSSLCAGA